MFSRAFQIALLVSLTCTFFPESGNAQSFEVLRKITLQPGEEVIVRSDPESTDFLGWKVQFDTLPEYEQLEQCPDQICASLESSDGELELAALFGGFKRFPGKEKLVLKSKAPIPLPIAVLRED